MVFLHGCTKPTLAVLYQDSKEFRHLKTYELLLKEKEFGEGPWLLPNVESGASRLIPVPKPARTDPTHPPFESPSPHPHPSFFKQAA